MDCLLVIVDTETTGLTAQDDFCQLASILYRPGSSEVVTYETLAKPRVPIQAGAEAVHGIANETVGDAPASHQVADEWWNLVSTTANGADVLLVGHNVGFDVRFLRQHVPQVGTLPVIDTLRLARKFEPGAPKHKLEFLFREHHRLSNPLADKAHDALSDCWMAFDLLRLYRQRASVPYTELAHMASQPLTITTMPLGKHKGKPINQVPRDYLRWMLTQDWVEFDLRHAITGIVSG